MPSAVYQHMARGIRRFTDLRAWQACNTYKQVVYQTCADGPLSRDWARRRQIEESVAGPPAHLAEGFGRFSPPEFARYAVIARSSLMESQNHLRDAVDKDYITEGARLELDVLAEAALREVTGLMEYLQSAEALQNARRAKERRIATRHERRSRAATLKASPDGANPERSTQNREHRTEPEPEQEPRSEKREG
jgi:four helix bundle protein